MKEADIFPIEVDLSLLTPHGIGFNDDDDDDENEEENGNDLFNDDSQENNSNQRQAVDVDLLHIGQ
jgi:hypothetical protein